MLSRIQEARMTGSDAALPRKTFVVDTSILVSAPDALQNLTASNTVLIPFPVLQELDRKRAATNGVGYTARTAVRFLDDTQSHASIDQLRSGIPLNGGLLKFHSGAIDLSRAWPGFNTSYADDAIILCADTYQQEHPDEQVILVTRDAAMRCKARARGLTAEDYLQRQARDVAREILLRPDQGRSPGQPCQPAICTAPRASASSRRAA
jgi:PhoH-like ATPase